MGAILKTRMIQRICMIPFLALSGCGIITAGGGASTTCPAGTAQISIYDTTIERVCGCSEPSGQYFSSPGSLNCTVKLNTVVYFNYVGITLSSCHQMAIPALSYMSSVRNPSTTSQVDGYQFQSTGSFTFRDNCTNIGGTFTVNP
jgi:hypothetical protein